MKALNIVETAYRATLEEQDDPVIWIAHAMKGAGAELSVLLRGNAVNYTVAEQGPPLLKFGARRQKQGPRLAESVSGLIGKGVDVYAIKEDMTERGLEGVALIDGLKIIRRGEMPGLMESHDQVWHW